MPTKNDGPGSFRVRPANLQDSSDILRWRNDAHTRAMSFEQTPIDPERHAAWYAAALASEEKMLLIGEGETGKLGVVRFDRRPPPAPPASHWEVSITIAPEARGGGHGKRLLAAALAYFHGRHPDAPVLARIKTCNDASLRLFSAAGFGPWPPAVPDGPGVEPGSVAWIKYFS